MLATDRKRKRRRLPGTPGVAAILGIGIAAGLLSTAGRGSPKLGDMIVFAAGEMPAHGPDLRIAVHRPGQFGCILNLGTLRQTGGSFVVAARLGQPAPRYRLHWAGERTSPDSGDCGRSADMLIDPGDLQDLIQAANGYGAGSWRVPTPSSWSGSSGPTVTAGAGGTDKPEHAGPSW